MMSHVFASVQVCASPKVVESRKAKQNKRFCANAVIAGNLGKAGRTVESCTSETPGKTSRGPVDCVLMGQLM